MRLQRLAVLGAAVAGLVLSAPSSYGAVLPAAPAPQRVAAGDEHACALVGGAAYCWGSNASGQLGAGASGPVQSSLPLTVAVPAGVSFVSLTAGTNHTCGLTGAGSLYCWGSDADGALGNGDATTANQSAPSPVDTSALPAVPRRGTAATAVAIGERAARLISGAPTTRR